MSISLYTGIKSQLLVTPGLWVTSDVNVVLLKGSYVFNADHTNADLLLHSDNNPAMLTFKTYSSNGDGYSFDAGDATILGQASAASYVAFYYSNGPTKPICMLALDSVWGLPGQPRGGPVTLAFPNAYDKIFSITSEINAAPATLVAFAPAAPTYEKVTDVSRPVNNITSNRRLVADKNNQKNSVFIDVNLLGHSHPLTGDLTYSVNQYAINQSLKNILMTSPTERPFSNIGFGGGVNDLLFNIGDPTTLLDARLNIINSITNFESRIILNDVALNMLNDSNKLSIKIEYTIKSTGQSTSFETFLERV